jgi:hypothetical protein
MAVGSHAPVGTVGGHETLFADLPADVWTECVSAARGFHRGCGAGYEYNG